MLFLDPVNPALCCSTDGTRYMLSGVCIRGGHAIATDGRAMLVTAITRDDTDDPTREALIPAKAVHAARKKGRRKTKRTAGDLPSISIVPPVESQIYLTASVDYGSGETSTYREILSSSDGYPRNLTKALADHAGCDCVLSINARLLAKLVAAADSDVVHLHLSRAGFNPFYGPTVFLTFGDASDSRPHTFGALQPIRYSESQIESFRNLVAGFVNSQPA